MAWLTKLRRHLGYDEPFCEERIETPSEDVVRAYESAKDALGQARQRHEEVRAVSATLSELRARNHFGESIELAMMRRRRR